MTKKEKAKEKAQGAGYLAGAAAVGGLAVKHGAHRTVGVRLESHSTHRDTAKKIMKEGGTLDPKYGGKAGGVAHNSKQKIFTDDTTGHVFITGTNKKSRGPLNPRDPGNPLDRGIHKYLQRANYRGLMGAKYNALDPKNKGRALKDVAKGALHLKGKTLYHGGSEKHFDRMKSDPYDLALKTDKKIKVSESRGKATLATLKKYGRGSHIKGAKLLMKHHKGRVATGVAILGAGGTGAAHLAKKGYNKLKGESLLTRTKDKYKKIKSKVD